MTGRRLRFNVSRRAAAIVVLSALVLAACSPTKSTPRLATSPEDIAGTWERQADPDEDWRHIHLDDGTLRYGKSLDALDSGTEGTDLWIADFWFEGTRFNTRDTTVGSCLSEVGIYEVTLLANGHLLFAPLEDGCRGRTATLQGTKISLDEDPYAEWAPVS